MKKVKFMLIAIAVFAVVGGALAFKAKKGSFKICYTTDSASGQTCATLAVNSTVQNPANGWYSVVPDTFTNDASCQAVTCPVFGIPDAN